MAVNKRSIITRYFFIVLVMCVIGIFVIVKGGIIMFAERNYWLEVADRFVDENIPIRPNRGNILSSDGKLMASSLPEYRIYMDFMSNEKDPVKFGTLSVELPADAGFSQTDLNRGTPGTVWKRTGDGTLRVETGHQRQAGVSTPGKPTPGGAEYEVEFEARGTAPLIVMVTGKGITRIDPLKHPLKLTGEWKTFRAQLSLPAEAETFTVALFAWQQKEKWFEIRKFRVSPRNR